MSASGPSPSTRSGSAKRRMRLSGRLKPRKSASLSTPRPPPPGDIVVSTFANVELAAAKAASEVYRQQFEVTDAENAILRDDLEEHEADSIVVIRHLEAKLEMVVREGERLRTEVNHLRENQHTEKQQLAESYEAVIKDRDRQIAEYATLTGKLQGDLRQVSHLVQRRQEHTMELKQLQSMLEEMAETHERELSALRFQTVDRKMKLVAMEVTMRNEFQSVLELESAKLLEAQHKGLLNYSRALESEKMAMAHDIKDLMLFTGVINTERTTMKRKAELHKQAHEEVLRHTVARNRRGRDTELKVQQLEGRVRSLLATQRTIKETVSHEYEERIRVLNEELKETKHVLHTLRQDLMSMRTLASHVVEQRTNLEKFFHVAVQDCRRYRAGLNNTLQRSAPHQVTATSSVDATQRSPPPPHGSHKSPGSGAERVPESFRVTHGTFANTLPPVRAGSSSGRATHQQQYCGTTFVTQGGDLAAPKTTATHSRSRPATPPPDAGSYVDDMPWDDKEKVIKALLFYINSTYYQEPHSKRAADDRFSVR